MPLNHKQIEELVLEQGRDLCDLKAKVDALQATLQIEMDVGRIAAALEGFKSEFDQTQDILLVIAQHLIGTGGMTAEQVEQMQAEARELVLGLQRSRRKLSAAVESQTNPS